MSEPYHWDHGTLLARNGQRINTAKPDRWPRALAGHIESAHNGQVLEDCPACRELQKKCQSTAR